MISAQFSWAPDEDGEVISTRPVIGFRPHRHFPVGADQPRAEVAQSGVILAVPVAAIVAFRPDPGVRRAWEQTSNTPASPTKD